MWPGVHSNIIVSLQRDLAARLRPDYIVAIEERVYLVGEPDSPGPDRVRVPDVTVLSAATSSFAGATEVVAPLPDGAVAVQMPLTDRQKLGYLAIRMAGNRRVVAVLELLSPTNKRAGRARQEYLSKRTEIAYETLTHFIEIDLLRAWQPMPVVGVVPPCQYRILVSNGRQPDAQLYPFNMQDQIPRFVVPLDEASEGIGVDLKLAVDDAYAVGAYDLRVDYQRDPDPPLSDTDRAWLDDFLRQQGLRNTPG